MDYLSSAHQGRGAAAGDSSWIILAQLTKAEELQQVIVHGSSWLAYQGRGAAAGDSSGINIAQLTKAEQLQQVKVKGSS